MPSRASTSLGSPKHLSRFIRSRAGKTIEEIAAEDRVSIESVKNSIQSVEFKQGYHTNEYLQTSLIGVILKLAPAAQSALLEAMTATVNRDSKNELGEKMVIKEPDHEIRLKAISEFQKIAVAAQPRAGHQTNVKVGVGIGLAGGAQASGSFVGMEERMRDIRQVRKAQPELAASTVQAVDLKTIEGGVVTSAADDDGDGDDGE